MMNLLTRFVFFLFFFYQRAKTEKISKKGKYKNCFALYSGIHVILAILITTRKEAQCPNFFIYPSVLLEFSQDILLLHFVKFGYLKLKPTVF